MMIHRREIAPRVPLALGIPATESMKAKTKMISAMRLLNSSHFPTLALVHMREPSHRLRVESLVTVGIVKPHASQ